MSVAHICTFHVAPEVRGYCTDLSWRECRVIDAVHDRGKSTVLGQVWSRSGRERGGAIIFTGESTRRPCIGPRNWWCKDASEFCRRNGVQFELVKRNKSAEISATSVTPARNSLVLLENPGNLTFPGFFLFFGCATVERIFEQRLHRFWSFDFNQYCSEFLCLFRIVSVVWYYLLCYICVILYVREILTNCRIRKWQLLLCRCDHLIFDNIESELYWRF